MANCMSVNIRPSKKYKPPSLHNLEHNTGEKVASYWRIKDPTIVQQPVLMGSLEAHWQNWNAQAEKRYVKAHGRKLRSNAVKIEEGMLIVGTDVTASMEQISAGVQSFLRTFAEQNDTRILHWAIHDHEGISPEQPNLHIHFLFDNVSAQGEMVRRTWKREYVSGLQDLAHHSFRPHIKGLERATRYEEGEAPKHKTHRQFKRDMAREQRDFLKEITEVNRELREELKDTRKAKQADYILLKKQIDELKNWVNTQPPPEEDFATQLAAFRKAKKAEIEDKAESPTP